MSFLKNIGCFFVKKLNEVFYLPELPVACPVCGQRENIILSIYCYGNRDLMCTDCEVIFSKEKPLEYKYTPRKECSIFKEKLLQQ